MENKVYSVYELNSSVRKYLENSELFLKVEVEGELSNITYYKSGHLYFTLKDEKAGVKCAAFKYRFKGIDENLKSGDKVKITGKVTLYESNGQYQIIVNKIEKHNELGKLFADLEKLKAELLKKGYFDESRKKSLPTLPRSIGIVSSGSGAAVRDIIETTKKRFENINIYVYPAKVQGDGSEDEIVRGIEVLDRLDYIDILIVGRGGGSIEDLWSFNKKSVVEAIYRAKKPIISAVGHEIDFLLSDMVADCRATTPTQAAQIAIPEKKQLKKDLVNIKKRLDSSLYTVVDKKREQLKYRKESYIINKFPTLIKERYNELDRKREVLDRIMGNVIDEKRGELDILREKLTVLDPKSILKRGYSISYIGDKVVRGKKSVVSGDLIKTILEDGSFYSVAKGDGDV